MSAPAGVRHAAIPRAVTRSRFRAADAVRTATVGLRTRALRAGLSALGIAVGIAAAVAVLGISASSKSNLLAQLGAEGNLLTVSAGQDFTGGPAPLPLTAEGMIARIPPVESVTATGYLPNATVRRTAAIPTIDTGGIAVLAVQPNLLATLGGSVARGTFLNRATVHMQAVVLGAVAARTLGISRVPVGTLVYIDGQYFSVVGILHPVPLAPQIDEAALVGFPVADRLLGLSGHPTELYLRSAPDQVDAVAQVLPFTANPRLPEGVQVSRPSDVLAARAAAKNAFTGLFLGLGAVVVLVGGLGVANIMVISVLERRTEVGLRRALGATRRQVGVQFMAESLVLSALGGLAGVGLGATATVVYAITAAQSPIVPLSAVGAGLGVAVSVGLLAGAYPALRAARLAPADALRTS